MSDWSHTWRSATLRSKRSSRRHPHVDHVGAVATILASGSSRIASRHGPGAPPGIFEGIAATKGFKTYYSVQAPAPGVDANRTIYHVGV